MNKWKFVSVGRVFKLVRRIRKNGEIHTISREKEPMITGVTIWICFGFGLITWIDAYFIYRQFRKYLSE